MENQRAGRMQKRRKRRLQRLYRKISIAVMTATLMLCLFGTVFSREVKAVEQTAGMKYYTSIQIDHGDSLWSIADEYCDNHYSSRGAYVKEVASINGIGMYDKLLCGEYLVVPYYK